MPGPPTSLGWMGDRQAAPIVIAGVVNGEAPPTTRHISQGTVWTVGGTAPTGPTVDNGRGQLIRRGTNATVHLTAFCTARPNLEEDLEKYQGRVATALDIDRTQKVLSFDRNMTFPRYKAKNTVRPPSRTIWDGSGWTTPVKGKQDQRASKTRILPSAPFKVLDAPNLRDDFYCSILAYSPCCETLAVGLDNTVYAWHENTGVRVMHGYRYPAEGSWVTSLAFSSVEGGKCILAIGRSDCSLVLKSTPRMDLPRFDICQPCPIACLSWRPIVTIRPSRNPLNPGVPVEMEDLLVGDETGIIYYYSVEWPEAWEVARDNWPGSMVLIAKISLHTQQICGLSWSFDGMLFASGGNDNLCCLTEVNKILARPAESDGLLPDDSRVNINDEISSGSPQVAASGENIPITQRFKTTRDSIVNLESGSELHQWAHRAAVKAIAFCPWQDGLVATGGGSNDKCIHFYHTLSGSALATIAVSAQVTSLIWSTTRREIAATFGYSQPDHPYRIAVFSWPDCRQVAAVPWDRDLRALYAISYPLVVEEAKGTGKASPDGCIIVASSDRSVKFHEVWSCEKRTALGGPGTLGGSDILKGLEGIDKEGDVIR